MAALYKTDRGKFSNGVKIYRPTWAEVNLNSIAFNFRQIRDLVGRKVKTMAVVKANAYGHGIVEVSRALNKEGVDYLGVASIDEALALRRGKVNSPILVLGSVLPHEISAALKHNISLTLSSHELFKAIKKLANSRGIKAKVHVKVDTGMGRIGIWHEEALNFIKEVYNSPHIDLEGLYTHFSIAARDKVFTQGQIELFEHLINEAQKDNIDIPYKHAANSIATVNFKRSHMNLVRPGLIIYGMYPKRGFERLIKLKPALSLKTKIVFLKRTSPGRSISYGRTYITQKYTKVATLPIGYADGYGRVLSNKAQVLVRGERAPVIGKVTMDQTMVDVGHIKNVKVGDEVVLIGRQGGEWIKAEKLARLAGTIPYEIICSITDRVPRKYT